MSLFQLIVDQLPSQSGLVLGQVVRFVLPRDYAREGFVIVADIQVATVAATIAPEGVFSIFKKVRLTGNDGGQNRDLVNADALSLVQRHLNYNNGLDTTTLVNYNNAFSSTGQKTIRVPFLFAPGGIEDPTRSLFLANLPRFNNDPILEITLGAQADVDTNATPTFAITAATTAIRIVDYKRFVSTDSWNFLKTDFVTYTQAYTLNAAGQRYNIPVPGWHFAIGMRMYSSATALGDISQTDGVFKIQALNVVERLLQAKDLLAVNQWSVDSDVSTTTAGVQRIIAQSGYWFDYLTDLTGSGVTNLDTLLNSNPYVALGTAPQVIGDINGGTGKQIVFMHDRCYGDIAPALLAPKILAKK